MHCFERDSAGRNVEEDNDNMDKFANLLCWATGTFVYPEDEDNISPNM